jgi:hypothetical protein
MKGTKGNEGRLLNFILVHKRREDLDDGTHKPAKPY